MVLVNSKKYVRDTIAGYEKMLEGLYGRIYYSHFDIGDTGGVLTIAVTAQGHHWYGWSICSPEDQFGRTIGRYRAIKRLYERRRCVDTKNSVYRPYALCEAAAEDLMEKLEQENKLPSWCRE